MTHRRKRRGRRGSLATVLLSAAAALAAAPLLAGFATGCLAEGGAGGDTTWPQGPARGVDLAAGKAPGWAIGYSGYRLGHSPRTGELPTEAEVLEDLRILARRWRLIRVYGADAHSEDVLRLIRRERLPLAVMLGIWLDREPGSEEVNARQVENGIRLANEYTDVVAAVNVGNEVRVEWTEHPVPEERLLRYVRRVRAAVPQPITVADNYVWWRDDGADLAREVDFLTIHSYPLWERKSIDEALAYTIENYEGVRAAHPGKPIVIGEAGWATYTEGNLHLPRAGSEEAQKRYFDELMQWSRERGVVVFWFEAFDEPWKGTGTEGHWGLFSADRKAKLAVREWFPDLVTDAPTSPSYPEHIPPSGPAPGSILRTALARSLEGASVNPLGPDVVESGAVSREDAEGGDALRLVFAGESWGGVYVILGRLDAGEAEALALRLRLPADVASLELKVEGPEGTAATVDALAHTVGVDEAGWTVCQVPLRALAPADPARLAIVGVWNPRTEAGERAKGEILLDDLHLE